MFLPHRFFELEKRLEIHPTQQKTKTVKMENRSFHRSNSYITESSEWRNTWAGVQARGKLTGVVVFLNIS